jgi:HTH-type transcriptional regulator/antitoxin HigA
MAITEISPIAYGKLLAKALPKVIETDQELDRYVAMMELFDRRIGKGERLSPEEEALLNLLERLVKEYDDQIELPPVTPHRMIAFLMEHRNLRRSDLLPIFGSRSVASEVLSGKREPSKAHIRKLAEFFHVSPAVFLGPLL